MNNTNKSKGGVVQIAIDHVSRKQLPGICRDRYFYEKCSAGSRCPVARRFERNAFLLYYVYLVFCVYICVQFIVWFSVYICVRTVLRL